MKWHPSEMVRDRRMVRTDFPSPSPSPSYSRYASLVRQGKGDFIRAFSIMPIHSYWNGMCWPPSYFGSVLSHLNMPAANRAYWEDYLSAVGIRADPELGRVLYEAMILNDEAKDKGNDGREEEEDKRELIIVKPPFVLG